MKINHKIIIVSYSLMAVSCENKEAQKVNLMNDNCELIMTKEDMAERVIQESYKGEVSIDAQPLKDRVHFLNQCLVKMGFSHE